MSDHHPALSAEEFASLIEVLTTAGMRRVAAGK
jgi:hypothetical protein